jgi:hypothetical protein
MPTTPLMTPDTGPRPVVAAGRAGSSTWTPGRILWATLSGTAVLGSVLLAAAAGAVHLVDENARDGDYITSDPMRVSSAGHAVTVEEIDLDGLSGDWLLGTARVRATAAQGSSVFIGVAPTEDVAAYLDGVAHSTMTELDDEEYDQHPGGAPSEAPADRDIWEAQASGPGTQTLTWTPEDGNWTMIVMNQDGSAGVDVSADVGATAPILPRAVKWLLGASLLSGVAGALGFRFLQVYGRRRSGGAR